MLAVWISQQLINAVVLLVTKQQGLQKVTIYFSLQIGTLLLTYVIHHLSQINERVMENILSYKIRKITLRKIDRLPFLNFENPEFLNKFGMISGIEQRISTIVIEFTDVVKNFITIISVLGFLININWLFVFILSIGIVPMYFIELNFGSKRYELMRYLTPFGRREFYLRELFLNRDNLKEIRLYNLGEHLIKEWGKYFKKNTQATLKILIKQNIWTFVAETVLILTYSASGAFTIFLIWKRKVLVGSFIAVLQAIQNVQEALEGTVRTISKFYENSLYIQEYINFNNMKELPMIHGFARISHIKSIKLNGLQFCYPNQIKPVLKDIELHIEKGKKIAIVGDNGSGKTTLIKCITGLYPTDENMIQVNGIPLGQLNLEDYQNRISVLFQNYNKYQFTAKENIGFGRVTEMEDQKQIKKAAIKTGIDNFICHLPEKYNSLLGRLFEGGNDLSGGQWQKIALSRTIFRNSDLIILDEPTAALDPQAEIDIINNLLSVENTVMFITHRLGAACLADEIIVMKEGSIIERGSHEQLMMNKGEYCKLFESQTKWYIREEEKRIIQ